MKQRKNPRFTKTADDRLAFYIRKSSEYGARLRSDPEYDRWYIRRARLISYRNHVFKLSNREAAANIRKRWTE